MLTDSQRKTFKYICQFHREKGYSPKLREIAEGIGIKSKGVVHRYVQALVGEGLIEFLPKRHRGIRLALKTSDYNTEKSSIPLMGKIAAGQPIEAISDQDNVNLSEFFWGPNRYILEVKGDSMINAGIFDGDMVVVDHSENPVDGSIVVALIDHDEATLKYLRRNNNGTVSLIPANHAMAAMVYKSERIKIQGVVVRQMRSY